MRSEHGYEPEAAAGHSQEDSRRHPALDLVAFLGHLGMSP